MAKGDCVAGVTEFDFAGIRFAIQTINSLPQANKVLDLTDDGLSYTFFLGYQITHISIIHYYSNWLHYYSI